MATLPTTDLSGTILQVSAVQFDDNSIQNTAANNTITINGHGNIANVNVINANGLTTTTLDDTVTIALDAPRANTITVKDEGNTLPTRYSGINFTGTGVTTVTAAGTDIISVNIPGTPLGQGITAPVITKLTTVGGVSTYDITGYTNNATENYLVFLQGALQQPEDDFTIGLRTITLKPTPTSEETLVVFAFQLPVNAGNGNVIKYNDFVTNTSANILNFTGNGVSIAPQGNVANITITDTNTLHIMKNSQEILAKATALNFTGNNITLSNAQDSSVVTIAVTDNGGNSFGITGISVSTNDHVINDKGAITGIVFEGAGVGYAGDNNGLLGTNTARVSIPGTAVYSEGVLLGNVNTLKFAGQSIQATVDSTTNTAFIRSVGIAPNNPTSVGSLSADSLHFPPQAATTLTTQLTSNGEYLIITVNGVNKAIKLFDIGI